MTYNRWSEYRRRNRVALAFVLGGMLGIVCIAMVCIGIGISTDAGGFLSLLVTVWFIGSIVTSLRAAGFRCPRCGELFFKGNFYHNGFARRCVHCGLPKWEEV